MLKNFTKLPILLFCLFGMLISAESTAQIQRMVIVEHFSNASCIPCAQQNPAFNNLLQPNLDRVIPVKFQTSWPGFDPYNQQNPVEVQSRVTHYGVTGVPAVFLDGLSLGIPNNVNQNSINTASAMETWVEMDIDVVWNEDNTVAEVTVLVNNLDSNAITGNHRLQLLLLEAKNDWPFPPGSTNEQSFSNVMRKMYPNADGTFIGDIAGNAELTFEFEVGIPDYIFDLSQMRFVAFVENPVSRRIHNGVLSDLVELGDNYPDMALVESLSNASEELCNRTLDAGVVVSNSGSIDVTAFTVEILIGSETLTYNFDGVLEPGQDYEILIPGIELMGGTNNVSYNIASINDGTVRQVNLLNTVLPSEFFPAISDELIPELSLDFESDPVNTSTPSGLILATPGDFIRVISQASFNNPPGPLGGYGMSTQSLWANFWHWNPASVGGENSGDIMSAHLVDLEGVDGNLILSFDRAYARYTEGGFTSNDGLRVHVSDDCGDTWTQIYSRFGAALQTVPPRGTFFMPTANQWASDTIEIPAVSGDELLVRFEVVSDWGNNLFLDNIKVEAMTVNATEIDPLSGSLSIFPNPASDKVNFEFQLESERELRVEIFDVQGRLVDVVDSGSQFNAGFHSLSWETTTSGLYFVRFNDGKNVKVDRFTVVR
ncbi:MAG: T9SS C-terminal target domain-containing protein [Saprospirales bacterium]|nr:MAG: T9SS C-terminal target domain-containing protein [Saprospirales bacterium]